VQPAEKLPRIGVLALGIPSWEPSRGGQRFRQGLRELGYIEGQTITLEVRWAENQPERYPDLAMDLVRLPVDIIVAGDAAAALAAQHATSTIPIVMAVSADPVRDGFELVINLKTAQALGLTIPPTLLFQATEVIR
jgi:putative tryptophan/tyrosine transport system substrate-binding protein